MLFININIYWINQIVCKIQKQRKQRQKNLLKRTLPDSRSKESEVSVIYQKLSNSGTVNVIGGKNRGDPEKPVSTVCFLCGLRELDTFLQSSLHLKKKTVGFPSRKIRYTVYRTQNCIQSGSFQTGKKTSVITSAVPVLRKNPDVTVERLHSRWTKVWYNGNRTSLCSGRGSDR
jgi:hypothetical protein